MNKHHMIYEGKAKKVYATDLPDVLIQEFKDSATAFNGEKTGTIEHKGQLNAQISIQLFKLLENARIKTHYLKTVSENEIATRWLNMILVEVVVRNVAAGSLAKRLGYPEGHVLKKPIIEFYYKNDELGDPLINEDHIEELGLAKETDMATIKADSLKINHILVDFFDSIGITLVDYKLEFGFGERDLIYLGDEISPDTCRLWDKETGEKLDKDRFRFDLGKVEEAYQEILKRVRKR